MDEEEGLQDPLGGIETDEPGEGVEQQAPPELPAGAVLTDAESELVAFVENAGPNMAEVNALGDEEFAAFLDQRDANRESERAAAEEAQLEQREREKELGYGGLPFGVMSDAEFERFLAHRATPAESPEDFRSEE